MQFIKSPNTVLGIDFSDLSLKATEVRKKRGVNSITALNSAQIPEGIVSEGEILKHDRVAKIIKKLIDESPTKFSTRYVVLSLPEPKTFIKVIEITSKDAKKNKVRDIILKELPRHVPIDINEVQLDWQEIGNDHKSRKFLVGTVPKVVVDDYIKVCKLAGLVPVALEIEAQAIARSIIAVNRKSVTSIAKKVNLLKKKQINVIDPSSSKMIVDLGASRTGLIVVDNGLIQFANSLAHISGKSITERISRKKSLSLIEAEKAKLICGSNPKKCKGIILDVIEDAINELIGEIIGALEFYENHFSKSTENMEIVLCGGGANLSGLDVAIKEKLRRNVLIADPLINTSNKLPRNVKNIASYTTAIGLALRNNL